MAYEENSCCNLCLIHISSHYNYQLATKAVSSIGTPTVSNLAISIKTLAHAPFYPHSNKRDRLYSQFSVSLKGCI